MEKLRKAILEFREERDWKQFHTPENLAKSIVRLYRLEDCQKES